MTTKPGDVEIRAYRVSDEEAVVRLWRDCGLVVPWNDPHKDIQRKLNVQADLFLVGLAGDRLVATVMAGYGGHRGLINYLAVAPDLRRRGIGRRMVEQAESLLRALGCPKINLQVRTSNTGVISFYEAIGYATDEVISLGKRLEADL